MREDDSDTSAPTDRVAGWRERSGGNQQRGDDDTVGMTCTGWLEVISAGGDGELSRTESVALDAHLARCAPCRELSDTVASLRRRTLVAVVGEGRDLVGDVLEARHQEVEGARALRRRMAIGLGAVAAVLVAIFLAPLVTPGSGPSDSHDVAGPGHARVVTIDGTSFSDPTLTVATGSTVEWQNQSEAEHRIVRDVGAATVSADLAPGQAESVTFAEPGSYPYRCIRHDGMTGSIQVRS